MPTSLSDYLSWTDDTLGYDPLRSEFRSRLLDLPTYGRLIVSAKDEYRADLISSNLYGTSDYWWVLLDYNGIDDPFDLTVGKVLDYPSLTSLSDLASLVASLPRPLEEIPNTELFAVERFPSLTIASPANRVVSFRKGINTPVNIRLNPLDISSFVEYELVGKDADKFSLTFFSDGEDTTTGYFSLYPKTQNIGDVVLTGELNATAVFRYKNLITSCSVNQFGDSHETQLAFSDGGFLNEVKLQNYLSNSFDYYLDVYSGGTDVDISVSPKEDWLTVIDKTAEIDLSYIDVGVTGESMTITAGENKTELTRSINFVVKSGDRYTTVRLNQRGFKKPDGITEENFFSLDVPEWSGSYNKTTLGIGVYFFDQDRTVLSLNSTRDWIKLSTVGGIVVAEVEENTGRTIRDGQVTITGYLLDAVSGNPVRTLFKTCVIKQGVRGVASEGIYVSEEVIESSFAGIKKEVGVVANGGWTYSFGNKWYRVNLLQNKNGFLRYGSIAFSNSTGGAAVLNVIQPAYAPNVESDVKSLRLGKTVGSREVVFTLTNCAPYDVDGTSGLRKLAEAIEITHYELPGWVSASAPELIEGDIDSPDRKYRVVISVIDNTLETVKMAGLVFFTPEGRSVSISITQLAVLSADDVIRKATIELKAWENLSGVTLPAAFYTEMRKQAELYVQDPTPVDWADGKNPYHTGTYDIPYFINFNVTRIGRDKAGDWQESSFSTGLNTQIAYFPNLTETWAMFYANKHIQHVILPRATRIPGAFALSTLVGYWQPKLAGVDITDVQVGNAYSGGQRFGFCLELKEVVIEYPVRYGAYNGDFAENPKLSKVDWVIFLRYFTSKFIFKNCTSLENYAIPLDGVNNADQCFYNTRLSVESIIFVLKSLSALPGGATQKIGFQLVPNMRSDPTTETVTVMDDAGIEYTLDNAPLFTHDTPEKEIRRQFILAVVKKKWIVET